MAATHDTGPDVRSVRAVPEMHRPRIALRRRLFAALGIAGLIAVVEVVGSWLSGSLALLSDAGHVGMDAIGLGVTLGALWMAERPHTPKMSFGYHRIEVLASLVNGLLLLAIAAFVVVQAYGRSLTQPPIAGGIMFVVGLAALVGNLGMLALLRGPARGNIGVRGAFLNVFGDALGSVGVVVGAVLIQVTGILAIDTVVALLIAILIVVSAARLLRDVGRILLEASPAGIRPEEIAAEITSVEGVQGVHDLHVWTVTTGLYWLTGHILVSGDLTVQAGGEILERIQARLRERFRIAHATLQMDSVQQDIILPAEVARGDRS